VSQIPTYAQIVESAAPGLLRLAVMLTGSRKDAEDLLQATVLRTHRHADRLEAMAAPVAYLRRVMVNEHISSGRRRARRVRWSRPSTGSTVTSPTRPCAPTPANHGRA
jgi:DNA-directed RNA polymerase specialized sigma24 family protein